MARQRQICFDNPAYSGWFSMQRKLLIHLVDETGVEPTDGCGRCRSRQQ